MAPLSGPCEDDKLWKPVMVPGEVMLLEEFEAPGRLSRGADDLEDISLVWYPALRTWGAGLAFCCVAAFSSRNLCLAALIPLWPRRPRGPSEDDVSNEVFTSFICCGDGMFDLVGVWSMEEGEEEVELSKDCC